MGFHLEHSSLQSSCRMPFPPFLTHQRSYSSDPFHIFSGLVFYFCNCSVPLNQVYLPLCINRGAQVLTTVMSQCTHVIVFNSTPSTDLPPEVSSFPQIHVVSELWMENCIREQKLIDESPFLLKPLTQSNGMQQMKHQLHRICFFLCANGRIHLRMGT